MKNTDKRHRRRVRNLFFGFAFLAIFMAAATYAWFMGMQQVNVSLFEIEIAGTDSLALSLDGEVWDNVVTINKDNFNDVSYTNNTNTWGGKGLIPVSSVGKMDTLASRMQLYEKQSFTATAGGYRVLASLMDNHTDPTDSEPDGYVAFDLFIRNYSGRAYINELNSLDEEAVYLTVDSAAVVSAAGVANTGIENSIRIAFAQIGRVHGETTNPATITGITCNPDTSGDPIYANGITGICRDASIWEPNDTKHVAGAIGWYEASCRERTGAVISAPGTYSGSPTFDCGTVTDGNYYPTYAVNGAIASSDNVDVYDGAEYNGYIATTKLTKFPYFTDTAKDKVDLERLEVFTLAPNSITKVRVYIYLEGQDIDNYDFAAIGKAISINFGFTKQRFTDAGADYNLPSYGSAKAKPVITLLGSSTVTIAKNAVYKDAGATALDPDTTEDLTRKIVTINPVNTAVPGTYYVAYDVSDWWGNYAIRVTRTVIVTS